MARDKLLALAERVEAATGADRELDAAIYQALNPHMRPIPNCETWRFFDPAKTNHMTAAKYFLGGNATGVAKSYTSSFDAAMSLVPSGCEWSVNWCGNSVANVNRIDVDYPVHCGHAATPALALTAAALRARKTIDAQAERIAELERESARLRDGVMDMSSPVREQIYTAIRTFTCATVAEAEEATRAIIRLVTGATPSIPNARRSRREESGYPRTSDSTWHPGDEM